MADKGVREWMRALSLDDGQALEERVAVTDVAGCTICPSTWMTGTDIRSI